MASVTNQIEQIENCPNFNNSSTDCINCTRQPIVELFDQRRGREFKNLSYTELSYFLSHIQAMMRERFSETLCTKEQHPFLLADIQYLECVTDPVFGIKLEFDQVKSSRLHQVKLSIGMKTWLATEKGPAFMAFHVLHSRRVPDMSPYYHPNFPQF